VRPCFVYRSVPKTKNPPASLSSGGGLGLLICVKAQLPAAPEGVSVVVRVMGRIHLAGDGFWLREFMTVPL